MHNVQRLWQTGGSVQALSSSSTIPGGDVTQDMTFDDELEDFPFWISPCRKRLSSHLTWSQYFFTKPHEKHSFLPRNFTCVSVKDRTLSTWSLQNWTLSASNKTSIITSTSMTPCDLYAECRYHQSCYFFCFCHHCYDVKSFQNTITDESMHKSGSSPAPQVQLDV